MLGPVEIVDEVDSTNRVLLDRARAGAAHGAVLVAHHQTAGRGRLDRIWQSPPGASLLASVLVRKDLAPGGTHLVTMAAGVAAAEAVEEVAGVRPALKWPNDLVVEGPAGWRKLAGLLAEGLVDGPLVTAVVVGIGLNVNWPSAPVNGGVALNELAGLELDRMALLDAWLRHLDRWLAEVGSDRSDLLADYRNRCATIGQVVRVEHAEGDVVGEAVEVAADGRLVVDVKGTLRAFSAGDVQHLRPV